VPAEDRSNITMTHQSRADVDKIVRAGKAAGVRFERVIKGKPVLNLSAVAHYAFKVAAATPFAPAPSLFPLPFTPPSKCPRLSAAMAARGLTGPDVAGEVGCHRATVGQVLKGTLALEKAYGGALLAWVESVEAGP